MRFRGGYAGLAILVLVTEIGIALFVRDQLVRPYLGDVLAVILVHLALRAASTLSPTGAAAIAFLVGAAVEFGQYLELVDLLGLQDVAIARVVVGTSFGWEDFAAYAAGALLAVAGEWAARRIRLRTSPSVWS